MRKSRRIGNIGMVGIGTKRERKKERGEGGRASEREREKSNIIFTLRCKLFYFAIGGTLGVRGRG